MELLFHHKCWRKKINQQILNNLFYFVNLITLPIYKKYTKDKSRRLVCISLHKQNEANEGTLCSERYTFPFGKNLAHSYRDAKCVCVCLKVKME